MAETMAARHIRLLRFEDLAGRNIPYTRQHLARLERRGLFPDRLQLSPNRVAWYEHEIEEWWRTRPRAPQSRK
jgi:prophage regulatory protein